MKSRDEIQVILAALEAVREAREWTMEDWCKKAGVDPRTIAYWKTDPTKRGPTMRTLKSLAIAARVPVQLLQQPGLTAQDVRARSTETILTHLPEIRPELRDYIAKIIMESLTIDRRA